jgi:hypothetical protein
MLGADHIKQIGGCDDDEKPRQANDQCSVLGHGIGVPPNPTVPARQVEGGRTKADGTQDVLFAGHDQIAQLRTN